MPSQIKEKQVEDLTGELKTSAHLIITEYQGLTSVEFDELRAALRPLGVKYKVVKNRLAKIAFEKTGFSDIKDYMKGPSAIAYQGSDASALTKALFKFSETHSNLKVRAGRLFGMAADKAALKTISNLPSREVLIATLLGRLNSPVQKLMATMNEPLRSLHAALGALAKKKEAA